jgi:hypothetical protein
VDNLGMWGENYSHHSRSDVAPKSPYFNRGAKLLNVIGREREDQEGCSGKFIDITRHRHLQGVLSLTLVYTSFQIASSFSA